MILIASFSIWASYQTLMPCWIVYRSRQQPSYLPRKGLCRRRGADARLLVQGVGDRFDKAFDRDWGDDEVRQTRLVIIGEHDFDQAAISTMIAG